MKTHPPAKKPATIPPAPTVLPSSTATPILSGLQNNTLIPAPQSLFLPVQEGSYQGYNEWIGNVDEQMVRVIGGSLMETNLSDVPRKHPEWNAQPELHTQSAITVIINDDWMKKAEYPTSTRNGALHLVNQCDNLIVLQAADHTVFSFDIYKLVSVDNLSTCPVPAQ